MKKSDVFSICVGKCQQDNNLLSVTMCTQTCVQYCTATTHKNTHSCIWTRWESSGVLRFLPVRAWHIERALLLDLLAPLHAVSDGVTVQHSHIHTDTERATQGHSPLLSTGGFFMPPSPESITCLPLSASWGGAAYRLTKQMKRRQQGTVGCMRETDRVCEKDRQRNMPAGKVINAVWICMLHISL